MSLFDVLPDLNGDIYSPEVQEQIEQAIQKSANYIKEEVSRVAEEFLWSDFSSDKEDRGIEIRVPFRGKKIPVRIKRALSLDERQQANDAAFKLEFDEKGKPTIAKQDQSAFTKEVCLLGLKYWPFEYSKGKPVPINRETLDKADGGLLSEIANRILGITEVKKEELGPFESQSDETSSKAETHARS